MRTHVREHVRHQTLASVDARLKRLEEQHPTIPPLPLPEDKNELPVQVSLIIPSTTKQSQPISDDEYAKRITDEKRWFDTRFGGDTTIQEVGSYVIGNKIIPEKGAIVQASMSREKYRKYRQAIATHASTQRRKWGQHTLLVNVEGRTFITPKQKQPGWDDDKTIPPRINVT